MMLAQESQNGYFDVVIWFYWNSKDWKSLMDELSKSFFLYLIYILVRF